MWIHLSKVAREQRLEEVPLVSFAMRNSPRYSVIVDSKGPKVEVTLVDKLVADFRRATATRS